MQHVKSDQADADSVSAAQFIPRSRVFLCPEASARTGSDLAYDPVQIGWISADVADDLSCHGLRAGWPSPAQVRRDIVTFRAWQMQDAGRFASLLDNPKVWTHLPNPYPGPISMEAARDLIALSNDESLHIVRAIVAAGDLVGQVRLDLAGDEAELSYWLGEPYWKRGIASRAVPAFVRACLAERPAFDHMIARVKPENKGSLRVLERAGFAAEGRSNAAPDWIIMRKDRAA